MRRTLDVPIGRTCTSVATGRNLAKSVETLVASVLSTAMTVATLPKHEEDTFAGVTVGNARAAAIGVGWFG